MSIIIVRACHLLSESSAILHNLSRNHRLLLMLAVALAYYASGRAGLLLHSVAGVVSLIWPPSGIAFAAIWRFGRPALAGVMLGSLALTLNVSGLWTFSVPVALGNALPLLGACRLLRWRGVRDLFDDPASVWKFLMLGGVLAPACGATIGTLALGASGMVPAPALSHAWLVWWVGDAIGVLILAPPLLTLPSWRKGVFTARRAPELIALAAAIALYCWQVFFVRNWSDHLPLSLLAAPLIIWAALRFEFALVTVIVLVLAVCAIVATVVSHAGLPGDAPGAGVLYVNTYLATIAFCALAVGSSFASQRRAFAQLRSSEERFRQLFERSKAVELLIDAGDLRIIDANDAAVSFYGWNRLRLIDKPFADINVLPAAPLAAQMARAVAGERDHYFFQHRRANGDIRDVEIHFSPMRLGHTEVLYSVVHDITERKRAEARLEGQTQILRALMLNAPLHTLLHDLALFVEALVPNARCSIMLVDPSGLTMSNGAGPNIPEEYQRRVEGFPIGEGYGSCGTAAARKETVIAVDVQRDPLWAPFLDMIRPFEWLRACWSSPFFATSGEVLGTFAMYYDRPRAPTAEEGELIGMAAALAGIVVQRRRDEQRLRDSEQRFRATFEQAAVGVALVSIDGRWLKINQKLCDILGYSHDELYRLNPGALSDPGDWARSRELEHQLVTGQIEHFRLDQRYIRKDGAAVWVGLTSTVARDADGVIQYFISVIEDISERKRAEAEIERLALYDPLTGLPNRRLLIDRLQHALALARRSERCGALLYVDLDRFKHLNDARGHAAGDALLKLVAERLQAGVRGEDTVARLGGDEFVVLLENLGASTTAATLAAGAIAEKMRQTLEDAFSPEGYEHYISASVGVTVFPKAGEAAEDLLKEADTAMYRAKERSRNAVCFYAPEMQTAAELRLSLERDLRSALSREEFRLFLQPQVDVQGRVVGAEALLRWAHPEKGLIAPATFIPLAEDTGLIVPLGEWVLRTAASFVRRIGLVGADFSIAVNVSPRQFREPQFVEQLKGILRDSGADPRRLVLEITEGVVIADFSDTIAKMTELQRLGIRFSIDDFGTGYSSLAYLKRLPLHELKIDRTFISELPADANDVALVETILAVARHLQLQVVAEGVESAEQFEFLKRRGCDLFQGYHFGRPQSAAQLFEFLEGADGAIGRARSEG